jgi:hypothetical protein
MSTSADHHVQAIIDLLDAADDTEWTPTTPDVFRYWDRAQSEKGPGADQPAHLYVWSPTSSSLEQFSMDGTRFDRTDAIEIQIWSLDETEPRQLQDDVVAICSQYLDDNRVRTPYSTVEPTGVNDFREQKTARRTEHYVMSVEIDTRGLDATGFIDESTFDVVFDAGFA